MSTASGSNNAMPDRLITVVGQPKIIALKFKTGKVTRTGNTMYTLTSGLVAFFPPAVAAEIDSLDLDPGMPFTVCHHGRDRWTVERNGASPRAAEPAPHMSSVVRTTAVAPPSLPPAPVNGQGQNHADLYLDCFREAARIAPEMERIASGLGLHDGVNIEDLRVLATTLFIQRQR